MSRSQVESLGLAWVGPWRDVITARTPGSRVHLTESHDLNYTIPRLCPVLFQLYYAISVDILGGGAADEGSFGKCPEAGISLRYILNKGAEEMTKQSMHSLPLQRIQVQFPASTVVASQLPVISGSSRSGASASTGICTRVQHTLAQKAYTFMCFQKEFCV